jgi:multidrug efflux pump subunit AcrB
MEELGQDLPQGYGYEWTSIAYQENKRGTQGVNFGMAMVFVFLVLSAQYELGGPLFFYWVAHWRFGAFIGVSLVGLENNVYVQ